MFRGVQSDMTASPELKSRLGLPGLPNTRTGPHEDSRHRRETVQAAGLAPRPGLQYIVIVFNPLSASRKSVAIFPFNLEPPALCLLSRLIRI